MSGTVIAATAINQNALMYPVSKMPSQKGYNYLKLQISPKLLVEAG
jgi:hypothetical protein